MRAQELLHALTQGQFDERLRTISGGQSLAMLYERIRSVVEGFCDNFDPKGTRELMIFSAPGRTELGGNHTDHQNGWALAASVDLDTIACVARSDEHSIRVQSRGHNLIGTRLEDLEKQKKEIGNSSALVRGIAAKISALGYPVSGFDAYTETRVLRGAGLSSSAAFEVLIGTICNELSCGGALSSTQIAQIGQYAENEYYGKPCGLLDQLACATGGVIAVDFADPAQPHIRRCAVDFEREGYALCIIDSGANHADLDAEYAAIPREMGAVAGYFGEKTLAKVDEDAFVRERAAVAAQCGERAALRAEHFFAETKRAQEQYEALSAHDMARYLKLMRASGKSSEEKLQNVSLPGEGGDTLLRVIEQARELAGESGAARVHGGGFAGTAQAIVPMDRLEDFAAGMERTVGAGCCHVVHLRAVGGVRVI